ncbi:MULTISPECIES: hypothetical protein [Streptomyces]|uniref:hypothetical protein n=1 Tax=Streptomyces TaxID=1883 RepID=UPI00084BE43E|nr:MULTISPECIES: hypothetical protein [Streptomyces]TFI25634.1 hypothetical protein E4P36_19630 [Streptomyces sp. 4R-3d]
MSESKPARPLGPQGLLKRRRPTPIEEQDPSWQAQSAADRALRLPVSPLPDELLPLPEGFDLSPEAAARLAGNEPSTKRRAG